MTKIRELLHRRSDRRSATDADPWRSREALSLCPVCRRPLLRIPGRYLCSDCRRPVEPGAAVSR